VKNSPRPHRLPPVNRRPLVAGGVGVAMATLDLLTVPEPRTAIPFSGGDLALTWQRARVIQGKRKEYAVFCGFFKAARRDRAVSTWCFERNLKPDLTQYKM